MHAMVYSLGGTDIFSLCKPASTSYNITLVLVLLRCDIGLVVYYW